MNLYYNEVLGLQLIDTWQIYVYVCESSINVLTRWWRRERTTQYFKRVQRRETPLFQDPTKNNALDKRWKRDPLNLLLKLPKSNFKAWLCLKSWKLLLKNFFMWNETPCAESSQIPEFVYTPVIGSLDERRACKNLSRHPVVGFHLSQ